MTRCFGRCHPVEVTGEFGVLSLSCPDLSAHSVPAIRVSAKYGKFQCFEDDAVMAYLVPKVYVVYL